MHGICYNLDSVFRTGFDESAPDFIFRYFHLYIIVYSCCYRDTYIIGFYRELLVHPFYQHSHLHTLWLIVEERLQRIHQCSAAVTDIIYQYDVAVVEIYRLADDNVRWRMFIKHYGQYPNICLDVRTYESADLICDHYTALPDA